MSTTEDAITPKESEIEGKSTGLYWREQLDHAEQVMATWATRSGKIIERFRDERTGSETTGSRFNILWSNVQVLRPSLYGRPAKPEVTRRYMDADPVGRLASTILERCLDYEVEQFPDFDESMSSVVEDRLLPGRGTVWMRFEGFDENGAQITSSEETENEGIGEAHAPVDYVYWKDFSHSPARTWDEVWWVARATYLTIQEGVDRFGEVFRTVPLGDYQEDHSRSKKDRATSPQFAKKAKVFEIWNKRTSTVCWIAKDFLPVLDERPDPLQLEGFFPCPKPLFATTTNGSLIPVPDYVEYQDQAEELDSITARIDRLVDAVRAAGVCNGEFKELQRLLQSKGNILIPVDNWAGLAEKGGLAGAFELIDLSTIVTALTALYNAREAAKQIIYEICGISDILRGSTKAEETLGAQQLKANFGSLRLRSSQAEVARFASDIFKLKAQIICRFYPPMLLVKMSDILGTDDGQDEQMVFQALQLLGDANMRDFHIAVASDSLAQIDEDAEKAAASEAIAAISGFLKEALPVVGQVPQLLPMFTEMLLFITRRFRAGRSLESAIENGMKQLQIAASAPKGPSPEEIEAQMKMQSEQARIAADTQATQMKEQFAAQREQEKLAQESQLEQMKAEMQQRADEFKAQMEAEASVREQEQEWRIANLQEENKLRIAQMEDETKRELARIAAEASANQATMASDTTMKVAELNAATKVATTKPPEDPKAKADAEMPANQLESKTSIRIAELEKEAMTGSAALSATGEMFALGKGSAKEESPAADVPAEEKKPVRWKIVRDESGRMSELVAG
jgi:hypothetical protein